MAFTLKIHSNIDLCVLLHVLLPKSKVILQLWEKLREYWSWNKPIASDASGGKSYHTILNHPLLQLVTLFPNQGLKSFNIATIFLAQETPTIFYPSQLYHACVNFATQFTDVPFILKIPHTAAFRNKGKKKQ